MSKEKISYLHSMANDRIITYYTVNRYPFPIKLNFNFLLFRIRPENEYRLSAQMYDEQGESIIIQDPTSSMSFKRDQLKIYEPEIDLGTVPLNLSTQVQIPRSTAYEVVFILYNNQEEQLDSSSLFIAFHEEGETLG